MIALLLALQGPALPTVGDTVWVARTVALPQGAVARPREWTLTGDVEVLGPGTVTPREGAAEIRYPVTLWAPGPHTVAIPGPLILLPGGGVDSVGPDSVTVTARSVLPESGADTALTPRPAATLVVPSVTDPRPLMLWLGGGLLLAAIILILARPRPRRAAEAEVPPVPAPPPIHAWAEAGEGRAACEVGALSLRRAIQAGCEPAHPGLETAALLRVLEASRPAWPLAEIRRVLSALDAVRFGAAGGGGDVIPLLDDAERLAAQLAGGNA
jgi:hypothetical protein